MGDRLLLKVCGAICAIDTAPSLFQPFTLTPTRPPIHADSSCVGVERNNWERYVICRCVRSVEKGRIASTSSYLDAAWYLVSSRSLRLMRVFRSTWLSRSVVTVLVASLVAVLGIPTLDPDERTSVHERWVRSHLALPLSSDAVSAVDRALEAATEEPTTSLRSFTQAFATAYQAISDRALVFGEPDSLPSLDALFATAGVDAVSLYSRLQHRVMHGGPPAVLPRFVAAGPSTSPPSSRGADALTATHAALHSAQQFAQGLVEQPVSVLHGCLLRLLWSAQPLGP